MKLTVLFLMLGIISVSAKSFAQGGTISLQMENASLEDILQELKSHSNYTFVYSDQHIEDVSHDLFEVKDANLEVVMQECLEGTDLDYYTENDVVVIFKKDPVLEQPAKQQEYEIKGTVVDEKNIPLPGVSVVVKGTNLGTATDIDGRYVIKVDEKPKALVFTFVGMNQQEVAYTGQKVIDVVLSADTESLSEVVITGYKKVSKVRSTAAAAKVDSKMIQRQATPQLTESMEGLATGLNINVVSKEGRKEELELILRGTSTFNETDEQQDLEKQIRNSLNRQPLIVIDGFPYEGTFGDIDSENIKSIDVLKDAAATALWGLRASNGVLVITTKRGNKGKPTVSFSSNFTVTSKYDLDNLKLTDSQTFIDLRNESMKVNSGYNNALNVINYSPWGSPAYYNKYRAIDEFDQIWAKFYNGDINETERDALTNGLAKNDILPEFEDTFLQNRSIWKNNVSVNGGSEAIRYNFSASHLTEKGISKGDDYNRLNLSLTTDIKLHDKVNAVVDVSLIDTKEEQNGYSISNLFTGDKLARYHQLTDANGNSAYVTGVFKGYEEEFYNRGFDNPGLNPINEKNLNDHEINTRNLRLAAGVNYEINNWLTADVKYQYNSITSKDQDIDHVGSSRAAYINNMGITKWDERDGAGVQRAIPYGAYTIINRRTAINKVLRGSLNLNKVIKEDHIITAMIGAEASQNDIEVVQNEYFGYNHKLGIYNKTFSPKGWDGGSYKEIPNSIMEGALSTNDYWRPETRHRTVSTFFNAGYSYKAKYNIEGSYKVDQASAFGINARLAKNKYWAFSGSWNIAKEDFMTFDELDNLKLRVSYGKNGNMRRGLTTLTIIGYNTSWTTGETYASISSVGNPNLKPETTINRNIGIDFGLFNRIRGSIDVYKKDSKDLLVPSLVNKTFSMGTFNLNQGKISNKGIEISLNADVLKAKDFVWNANFNFSYNKNEVLRFSPEIERSAYDMIYAVNTAEEAKVIGKDISTRVFYRYAGLDAEGDPLVYDENNNKVSYKDPGFSSLTTDALKVSKPFIAPGFGGLTNSFKYKNWNLSAMITYKFGHVFQEALEAKYAYHELNGWSTGKHVDVNKRWMEAGDENKTMIPRSVNDFSRTSWDRKTAFTYSDYGLHDASHVRLKDITLSYQFDKDLIKKIGLSNASLMFQVRDLGLLWTANSKNIDPEAVPLAGRAITFGDAIGQSYIPSMKKPLSFVFGAKIQF